MVGLIGIEPMTSTMSTWRSNQLSYNPLTGFIIHIGAKKASTFFRFRQFDTESACFFFETRKWKNGSTMPCRHRAAVPRLNASRDPRRTTQKEKSTYSLRHRNNSKIKLPRAQASSRSSLLPQRTMIGMSISAAQTGMIPGNRGQRSAAFQQRKPPVREAVSTSAQDTV